MKQQDLLEEKEKEPVKVATIVSIISIVLNLLLGISKITIGKIMGFDSVFSDGVHSTGDVLTTIIALIAVWIAAVKKNHKYNYGHERWASIASLILSIILFVTAITIISESTSSLIEQVSAMTTRHTDVPETIAGSPLFWTSMGLSIASVVLKEIMFNITYFAAKKAHSTAMKADAWHQRIDALSSIAAIIALCGYYWLPNNNILDPILSYPIAIMVILIALEVFKKSARELTDHAIDDVKMTQVKVSLSKVYDLNKVKLIRSRIFSEKFYLEIFILEDCETTLKDVDEISDKIKAQLMNDFEDLKNVYVIAEPNDDIHKHQEEMIR